MASKQENKKQKPDTPVDLRKLPKDQRPAPTSGQSAPERELAFEDLSDGEKMIVKALDGKGKGARIERSVEFLSELFDSENAKLITRNSLRRPVAGGWVERAGRGKYLISERGRKRLARV